MGSPPNLLASVTGRLFRCKSSQLITPQSLIIKFSFLLPRHNLNRILYVLKLSKNLQPSFLA
jgi:hypothetical protein